MALFRPLRRSTNSAITAGLRSMRLRRDCMPCKGAATFSQAGAGHKMGGLFSIAHNAPNDLEDRTSFRGPKGTGHAYMSYMMLNWYQPGIHNPGETRRGRRRAMLSWLGNCNWQHLCCSPSPCKLRERQVGLGCRASSPHRFKGSTALSESSTAKDACICRRHGLY